MHFFDHKIYFLFLFLFFFFLPRLVPGIVAFVVIGLIPLSAPASWTHCVSFCSPQEGRTGASVFGLAMSKSVLLVLTQDGCTCLSFSLRKEKHSLVSQRGGTAAEHKPFHVWMQVHDGCHSSPVLQSCQFETMFTRMQLSVRAAFIDIHAKYFCALRSFIQHKNFIKNEHISCVLLFRFRIKTMKTH